MVKMPLAACADEMIRRLAQTTAAAAIARLDGATLLGERAMLAGWLIPGLESAGGGARLYAAAADTVALNLARADDRALLPALFETDELDTHDAEAIGACIRDRDAAALVARGRSMGLAIAMEHELRPAPATVGVQLAEGLPVRRHAKAMPRVLDLSALWAGPLAAHLLWLAGAEVVKVESRKRPDAMRGGNQNFYALLNQGKESVVLDFNDANDRRALLALIAAADIVIEAARPRGLAQLGIDAREILAATPGLVWMTITGHGAQGEAAEWVGFGDDCSVAAGLSAALRTVTGNAGFVGDAIADPLTGIAAAQLAWDSWRSGRGGRFGLALSHVTAHCLARTMALDPGGLAAELSAWRAATGQPFPAVQRRPAAAAAAFGAHTHARLAKVYRAGD
jgi:CoA-transferase family III